MEQQIQYLPTIGEKRVAVSSLQDMASWLNSLSGGASPAVKEALKSQIQVLRFIQSPTLIDTTFDTLLYSLDKSLCVAKDPKEVDDIREVFCLMIQNFAFFSDAKFQMAVNKNKEEGRQLFINAGELLSNSIKDIALLATSGATRQEISLTTINNLFSPANEKGGLSAFFSKLINFFYEQDIIFEQQKTFYITIETIINKLGEERTQKLLGKSNIIASTIQRYVPGLREFVFENNPGLVIDDNWWHNKLHGPTILVYSISAVYAFFRWIFVRHPWFWEHVLWTIIIIGVIHLIGYIRHHIEVSPIIQKRKELDDYFNSLYSIGESYKQSYDYNHSFRGNEQIPYIKRNEDEYLNMYKEYVADGEISERDRRMLDKFRVRCGISEEKARKLEASCNKLQLTGDEQEYFDEVKAMLEDGEIGPRERKTLERRRVSLGISEERAKELEKL